MPRSPELADTPYYVLMDGNRRVGPNVLQLFSGVACSPIYGFSDKRRYDKFPKKSQTALIPYPLVKLFLRDQAGASLEGLKLVVVDAAGPDEPLLHAATMEAVLEAQENRTTHVTAAYR